MANEMSNSQPTIIASILSAVTFSSTYAIISFLLVYLLSVSLLRHRRCRSATTQHPPSTYSTLTPYTAQTIVVSVAQLEFPLVFELSLQFALFRTYGIPTVSSLLFKTGLLSKSTSAAKRYADTDLLVTEIVVHKWGESRSVGGLARMNCIHGNYGFKAGDNNVWDGNGIKPEDMLYTLSLFAWEPVRWIERWEWRPLSEVERCAIGVFWKGVGDAMGMPWYLLPSGQATKTPNEESGGLEGWQDGLQWMDEIAAWAEDYEAKHMLPATSNHLVAEETTKLLLVAVPSFAKAWGAKAVTVLMDERLRRAMMYPPPPSWLVTVVHSLLYTRRFVLRYLMLPRPEFLRVIQVSEENAEGRSFMKKYLGQPWYNKPGFWNRWGVTAWSRWAMGLPIPGDEGDRFWPKGYKLAEVGPAVGRGGFETEKGRVERVASGLRGCPMGLGIRSKKLSL